MFNNLTIRTKMTVIAFMAFVLVTSIAAGALFLDRTLVGEIERAVVTGRTSTELVAEARAAHVNFQRQVQEWKNVLIRGNDPDLYERHYDAFRARAENVQSGLDAVEQRMARAGLDTSLVAQLKSDHADMLRRYLDALSGFDATNPETGKQVDAAVRGVDRATSENFDTLIDALIASTNASLTRRETESRALSRTAQYGVLAAIAITLLVFLAAFAVVRRVNHDIQSLNVTVSRLNSGNLAVRAATGSNRKDELNVLAGALNRLLDEKVTELERAQRENEQLNDSVIGILTSVAQLAQRDLNVKVPVNEDITGAVSDAINMMTTSTAGALRKVNQISSQVSDSSSRVRQRAEVVQKLADEASAQANSTSEELNAAANALRMIGDQAQDAGRDAERALGKTEEALTVVGATVQGITASRDQIRETEKRVKRLAERSQEISSAVSIIGKIAERTSVLALNASMQAVAAGEAGRGFAAVADEVKRLAENARDATQQIAGLVNAIQTDTTETLQAMNGTIAQVVDITRLADKAGTQMQDTRQATEALAASVRTISQTTLAQSEASKRLLARAYDLIDASQRTLEEIEQQRGDTEQLSESATALVRTVSEFRLPAA